MCFLAQYNLTLSCKRKGRICLFFSLWCYAVSFALFAVTEDAECRALFFRPRMKCRTRAMYVVSFWKQATGWLAALYGSLHAFWLLLKPFFHWFLVTDVLESSSLLGKNQGYFFFPDYSLPCKATIDHVQRLFYKHAYAGATKLISVLWVFITRVRDWICTMNFTLLAELKWNKCNTALTCVL